MFKKLSLIMTLSDAEEYCKNHPKWKLPTQAEIDKLIDSEVISKDLYPVSDSDYRPFFKMHVVLVPRIAGIVTGNTYKFDDSLEYLHEFIRRESISPQKYMSRSDVDLLIAGSTRESDIEIRNKLRAIADIMTDNDAFLAY